MVLRYLGPSNCVDYTNYPQLVCVAFGVTQCYNYLIGM